MRANPPSTIHHAESAWMIAGFCVFGVWWAAGNAQAAYTLSHGRQVILNRGIQIQGLVFPYVSPGFADKALWDTANYTTMNFWWEQDPTWLTAYPNTVWGRLYDPAHPDTKYLATTAPPGLRPESDFVNNFASFQYGDELTDINTTARQADMRATFDEWRNLYSNALAYSNFTKDTCTVAQLTTYVQAAHPDMLSFDYYPRTNGSDPVDYSFPSYYRSNWYSTMSKFRNAALAGWDGNGTAPIAYAQFPTMFRQLYTHATPSESFVRLQRFASWAFGYSMVSDFIYNDANPGSTDPRAQMAAVMFTSAGDSSPNTDVFGHVAEANRQSINLSPALARLVSSDIRMIKGSSYSSLPSGISPWSTGAGGSGDYITGITSITSSGGSDSSYPDMLVGYFRPLLDDNSHATFTSGLDFMLVNGMGTGTASVSDQWYRLTFDFGSSGFNKLARLSRDTGLVEDVPLTSTGGTTYRVDIDLPGGTGDLFCFYSGALPTIPEPGALAMLLGAGLFGTFWYAWRKRQERR